LATNTTESAPFRRSFRLAAYILCPGTAITWNRSSYPRNAGVFIGSRSKRMVRSWVELTETISPRRLGSARWWSTTRFVVLPPAAGP